MSGGIFALRGQLPVLVAQPDDFANVFAALGFVQKKMRDVGARDGAPLARQ
jgi:hypothetical protein